MWVFGSAFIDKSVWYALLLSIYQGGQLQQSLHTLQTVKQRDQLQVTRKKKDHPPLVGWNHLRRFSVESVAIAGSKEVADTARWSGFCFSSFCCATCHAFFFMVFFWDPRISRRKKKCSVCFPKKTPEIFWFFSVLSSCIHPPNTGNLVESFMILESGVGGVDPMSILYLPLCIRIHVRTFEIFWIRKIVWMFCSRQVFLVSTSRIDVFFHPRWCVELESKTHCRKIYPP